MSGTTSVKNQSRAQALCTHGCAITYGAWRELSACHPVAATQIAISALVLLASTLVFVLVPVAQNVAWAQTWSTQTNMPTASSLAAAVTGADGKIYVIGGANSSSVSLTTVEVFDPATHMWSAKANMPTARHALAAVKSNGKIYAIGGYNNIIGYVATVEMYDPVADTWTAKANMPTVRYYFAAATGSDGTIYAIGGINNSNIALASVVGYNTTTNTWSPKTSMPTARDFLLQPQALTGIFTSSVAAPRPTPHLRCPALWLMTPLAPHGHPNQACRLAATCSLQR